MISVEWLTREKQNFFAFSLNSAFLLHRSKAKLFRDGTPESVGQGQVFLRPFYPALVRSVWKKQFISGNCAFLRALTFRKVLHEEVPGSKIPGNHVRKTRKACLG